MVYRTVLDCFAPTGIRTPAARDIKPFKCTYKGSCGPGSVVGIATGYLLDCPGIESLWGRDFSHLSRPALEPNQPPVIRVPTVSRR
jgi:hypothetical protein